MVKQSEERSIEADQFDFNQYRRYLAKYWYLFVISLALLLFFAALYNRYKDPKYNMRATVIVRSEQNQNLGAEKVLPGMEIFTANRNIDNEIELLTSRKLIGKALDQINGYVQYYSEGRVRSVEHHPSKYPLDIWLDSVHVRLVNARIYIEPQKDQKHCRIKVSNAPATIYDPLLADKIGWNTPIVQIDSIVTYGDTLNLPWLRAVIKPRFVSKEQNSIRKGDQLFLVLRDRNDRIREIQKLLTVSTSTKSSSILQVELTGAVPESMEDILNTLTYQYIQYGLNFKNQIAVNTLSFIDQQLIGIEDSLESSEDRLQDYRTSERVIEIGSKANQLYGRLEALERDRSLIKIRLNYYAHLRDYVVANSDINNLVAPSVLSVDDPLLNSLIKKLTELRNERSVLESQLRETHPEVQKVRLLISNTMQDLKENLGNLEQAAKMQLDQRRVEINRTNDLLAGLPKTERNLVDRQRQFELNNEIYNYLMQKRMEVGIARASNTADNRTLDNANKALRKKISPQPKITFGIAIILGILFPALFALGMVFFKTRIYGPDDLDGDLALLGMLPQMKPSRKRLFFSPGYEKEKQWIFNEALRKIRANLQHFYLTEEHQVIGITSWISAEGKSFVSRQVVQAFASLGKKVILVECDMRKTSAFKSLLSDTSAGLSMYLAGSLTLEEILQKNIDDSGMDCIPAGTIPPNPPELLESQRMSELIRQLRKDYDYVMLDTPPIGIVSDYISLLDHIDCHLFVVRARYSKKLFLRNLIATTENYKQSRTLIINDINLSEISRTYHGYGSKYTGQYV